MMRLPRYTASFTSQAQTSECADVGVSTKNDGVRIAYQAPEPAPPIFAGTNAVSVKRGGEATDPQRRFELVSERETVSRIRDEDVELVRPHRLVRQQLKRQESAATAAVE